MTAVLEPTVELPIFDPLAEAQARSEIASGLRVPTYGDLLSMRQYVDSFTTAYRSSRDNGSEPVWFRQTPDGRELLRESELEHYRHMSSHEPWKLSAAGRQELEAQLQVGALGAADVFELIEQQNNAQSRLELDDEIRTAEALQVRDMWVNSRHAIRYGLGRTASDAQLVALQEAPLRERSVHVTAAPPITKEDRQLAATLNEQREEAAAKAKDAEIEPPVKWQRLRRFARAVMTLGLDTK